MKWLQNLLSRSSMSRQSPTVLNIPPTARGKPKSKTMISAAVLAAAVMLAFGGTANAQHGQSSEAGHSGQSSGSNKGKSQGRGKNKTAKKGKSSPKGKKHHKSTKKDKWKPSGKHNTHMVKHHDKERHESTTSKTRLSEHAGYPRLKGIGGRNNKGFDFKQVAQYNGERRYHKNRLVDKHYHEKYGHQFRYYCGDSIRHSWWYSGRYHYHWDHYCWNAHYKHWFFYDNCSNSYYYYCRSHDCYLPVECACSTCLATADDEDVPPCDEDDEDDSCCCDKECDVGGCECADRGCCSDGDEDEDNCDCYDERVVVELDDDE